MNTSLIIAIDKKGGISKDGMIPWKIKEDMQFFLDVTKRQYINGKINVLIMGKNTWLACRYTLKNRIIIVVSSSVSIEDYVDTFLVNTFDDALKKANLMYDEGLIGHIFICGGKGIYEEAVNYNTIYLTTINYDYGCNNIVNLNFDKYNTFSAHKFKLTDYNKEVNVTFQKLYMTLPDHWKPCEERQYLNLLYDVLTNGSFKKTRNAMTWSKFGKSLEFDLSKSVPLLTTKKWYFKGSLLEILMFVNADTNTNHLSEQGVKFWEKNTSREFLDSVGLNYEQGDFGNMYGFQLRHFNAEYKGMNYTYTEGFDQIEYCINLLKTDPYSRRIMMTTYNPAHAKYGTLFPCHGNIIIFNVELINNLYFLSCMMTQRSSDLGCALSINSMEYCILVYMICEVINNDLNYTGIKFTPGRLIMNLGDAHIYENHYTQMIRQILRDPYDLPKLKINRKVTDLTDFKYEDFELIDYCSYPAIQCVMVA